MSEAERGVCALCGQELIRTADDCWHPYTVARACPPEPPGTSVEWIVWSQAGNQSLRPGRENWRAS